MQREKDQGKTVRSDRAPGFLGSVPAETLRGTDSAIANNTVDSHQLVTPVCRLKALFSVDDLAHISAQSQTPLTTKSDHTDRKTVLDREWPRPRPPDTHAGATLDTVSTLQKTPRVPVRMLRPRVLEKSTNFGSTANQDPRVYLGHKAPPSAPDVREGAQGLVSSNARDTLFQMPACNKSIGAVGQVRAAQARDVSGDSVTLVPQSGMVRCATPPRQKVPAVRDIVNISPGGHATSTPYFSSSAKQISPKTGIKASTDMLQLREGEYDWLLDTPIRGNLLNMGLNESVTEVLDSSLQSAIPAAYTCGPTPFQFKDYVAGYWPMISGEKWKEYPQYVLLYERVRHTALPNFLAARVAIQSNLAIDVWRAELEHYTDQTLVDQLQFGFPSNYSKRSIPVPSFTNHRESVDYAEHIKDYIVRECEMGALLGPFAVPPFSPWSHCSPMMTRPKSTPGKRRIIVDLSYPAGRSVNAGIPRKEFLGRPHSYSLPSVSTIGERISSLGRGCYMWSADISRAYRQLRADPLAVPLFGITYEDQFYVDIALPFGCRSSGASCVRMTSALLWILQKAGYHGCVYVDDFIGVELSYLQAMKAFHAFIAICKRLGVELAREKCHAPSLQLVWIGFYIDTNKMFIAIPAEKLALVVKEAEEWLHRPRASRKSLQQLVGRLVYVCSCVQQGRRFLSRILSTLSRAHCAQSIDVDQELVKDIRWFSRYAAESNGVTLLPTRTQEEWVIECDSCLTGGGAFSRDTYFAEKYNRAFTARFRTIHALEAVNLVEAVATLCPREKHGRLIRVNTDNQASAVALQSGKCSDLDLGMCSRELWLMAALGSFSLSIVHKPGASLILADALSRAHMSDSAAQLAARQCAQRHLKRVRTTHSITRFSPNL